MTFLRIVIPLQLLVEHDSFPKTGTHPGSSPGQVFSGSCSSARLARSRRHPPATPPRSPKHNRRPMAPVVPFPRVSPSRAGIEHGYRAAVLRPARDVVADRDRALLAVGNRPHALCLDAARDEIIAHRLRPAGAERDVVLAGAALVGVALDGEGVLAVGV